MRRAWSGIRFAAAALLASSFTVAAATAQTAGNDDLVKMQENAANVVMPTITYDNQRYSKLDQINTKNVRQAAGSVDVLHRRAAWA